MTNRLYFGDCLEVMRKEIAAQTVDLVYLDPPFNSKRIYNASMGGAQWVAFKDTWRWHEAIDDYDEVAGDVGLAPTIEGLRRILGQGAELAYLSYMANRLRECHRVLKPTGSIYLHCDPHMSHYLKVVMDGIFGRENFLNEVIWAYRTGGVSKRWFGRKHDTILFYKKGNSHVFSAQKEISYNRDNKPYKFKGVEEFQDEHGRWYTMASLRDVWEINAIGRTSKERLGYPTQKPLALLTRIVEASSNKGDVVLDPFCGCGTTIEAAQRAQRAWIGIDICVQACKVIEGRMREHFDTLWNDVQFLGFPKTLEDAKTLARRDPFGFERWAASLVDGMEANKRQRGDGGIDGRGRIAVAKGEFLDLVCQVKGGATKPGDVQALEGARQQAGADLGIFVCFADKVTSRMRDAAASVGRHALGYPIVQIYTIEDFFAGRKPETPAPRLPR